MNLLTISLILTSFLSGTVMILAPVDSLDAKDRAHHKWIDILSATNEDGDKRLTLESADKSSDAIVEVEDSLSLELEKGERPSIDREHTVTFGDGEPGKRPPPSD
jgi:hypothetical protein